MAKTKAEKITSIEEEIRQLENRRRQLVQEQKAQERKDRTKRLCRRMGLFESLGAHNTIYSHWNVPDGMNADEVREKAATCEHYLLSANGLAETGEIINIDGTGNRVSSSLYGHKKVWFVVGSNKIAPTYDEALWRARNIAAPKNAQRLGVKTPCAVNGDRCYDCKSPQRICRGLVVLWEAIRSCETEVVLVDEPLGY